MLKEYTGLIAVEIVIVIFGLLFWIWTGWQLLLGMTIAFLFLLAGTLILSRDPERIIPMQKGIIVSPADGKVIRIFQHQEETFCHAPVITVSIFLRLWDVHINRMPVNGKILFREHRNGKYRPAMLDKASADNEQMKIGLVNDQGRFLIKQVAGMIARRIICLVQEGDFVLRGQRFGMIKFGSLVELSMPVCYKIKVRKNQRLKAGETVLGVLER